MSVRRAPAQVRAAALTASQCASYDGCKRLWMRLTGWSDSLYTHLGASMATGLVTTTVTAPVDVVKTNMFVGVPRCQQLRLATIIFTYMLVCLIEQVLDENLF
jgi:hypothetical protein